MGKQNARYDEFQKLLSGVGENEKSLIEKLVNEAIFLENELENLKKLPLIEISNKKTTRVTAAGKQYKEYLNAYSNVIKLIQSTMYKFGTEEQDAFDLWLNGGLNDIS